MKRHFLALLLLACGTQSLMAFSLLGPLPFNGADSFATTTLGYQLTVGVNTATLTDNGTPKNMGEGYRQTSPHLYYAFDSTFLSYFGSNGVAAVDQAMAVFNGLSNYSAYSATLDEVPQNTIRINYSALGLSLLDLKSAIMSVLIEQLGVAEPDRFVWTLHERTLPPGAVCPAYNYAVVQRNFDPVTYQYSSYVNGTLYGYNILELCPFNPNPLPGVGAETVPYPADAISQNVFTSVAAGAGNTGLGQYYNGLSRDDIGALRYLMGTNSIDSLHLEAMAATTFLVDKTNATTTLQTRDLAAFVQQAQTNAPAQLQALYPTLQINNFTQYFTNVVTTNITVYYLNPPLTNNLLYVTNYTTNVAQYYNYSFGNVITNHYGTTEALSIQQTNTSADSVNLILITNNTPQLLVSQDLGLLVAQSYTNPPAALQALYPDLQILSNYTSFRLQFVTNITALYAGSPVSPTLLVLTNISTNILQYYVYTFGNVHTNTSHFSTTEALTIQTNSVTTSPSSTVFVTNSAPEILSTQDLGLLIARSNTNNPAAMQALYPGLEILNTTFSFTNVITTNIIAYFTNATAYSPSNSAQVFITQIYSTNIIPTYSYVFGNVITNHYYTNGYVTTTSSSVTAPPYGSTGTLRTNTSSSTTIQAFPNGDFYLLPTNSTLIGYKFLSTQLIQLIPTLGNLIFATNNQTGYVGTNQLATSYSQQSITYFTNYNYQVLAINGIANGGLITNSIGSTRQVDANEAFNSVSGDFYFAPTSTATNLVDYAFVQPLISTIVTNDTRIATATNAGVGAANISFAIDQLTYATNTTYVVKPITYILSPIQTNTVLHQDLVINSVSGDFYIAPANVCGFQIASNQLSAVITNHNLVTIATNAPGAPTNAINFTYDYVTYFTNYTLAVIIPNCIGGTVAIRPGIDKVSFFRKDYDSLLSRIWDPIDDAYVLHAITNGLHTTNLFRRRLTQPDIIFQAADLVGPGVAIPVIPVLTRTAPLFNTTIPAPTTLAGPGSIDPGGTVVTINKGTPAYLNLFSGVLDDGSQTSVFFWGSYDGTTNAPVVYPDINSLANLQNQLYLQITSSGALTNGAVGVPYSIQLSAVAPSQNLSSLQWSLTPLSPGLPPGLSGVGVAVTTGPTITISGTPTQSGYFDFIVQVKDSSGRVSQRNFVIQIDP